MIIRIVSLGETNNSGSLVLTGVLPKNLIIERIGFIVSPNATIANPFPLTSYVNIFTVGGDHYVKNCNLQIVSTISGAPFRSIFGSAPGMANDFTDNRIKFNPRDLSLSTYSGGLSTMNNKVVQVEVGITFPITTGEAFMVVEARLPTKEDVVPYCLKYYSPLGVPLTTSNTCPIEPNLDYLYGIATLSTTLNPYGILSKGELAVVSRQMGAYGASAIVGTYNYDSSFSGLPSVASLDDPEFVYIVNGSFVPFTQTNVAMVTVTGQS